MHGNGNGKKMTRLQPRIEVEFVEIIYLTYRTVKIVKMIAELNKIRETIESWSKKTLFQK